MQTVPSWRLSEAQLHAANMQLAQATPAQIIRWASAAFGPSVCFATMLDAEGCALVALLATEAPQTPVLMPDTGYLSPQVLSLRASLQQRYQLPIRLVQPSMLSAAFESEYGPLYRANPSRCCRVNRWEPMRDVLSRYAARIAARRRALCPTMREITPVAWEEALQLVQINPLAHWSNEELHAFLEDQQVPHLPLPAAAGAQGCAICPQRWEDVVPSPPDAPTDLAGERHWRWPFSRRTKTTDAARR